MARWHSVRGNGTSFVKWETPGQVLEGIFEGTEEGEFGLIGKIRTDRGSVRFPVRVALSSLLEKVRVGQMLRVEYLGEQVSKAGRTFKAFDAAVLVEDDDAEQEGLGIFPPRAEEGHPLDDPGPERTEAEGESAMANAELPF